MTLPEDAVVLTLGGESVLIAENYEVRAGIFEQPSGFAIRLGSSATAAKLLAKYPENTPFTLSVNGRPAQSGFTDGFTTGEGSGATMVTFKGRDIMAPVTKAMIRAERGFSGLTYAELTEEVLSLCFGFTTPEASKFNLEKFKYTRANGGLVTSNRANRERMSGKARVEITPASVEKTNFTVDGDIQVTLFRNPVTGTSRDVYKTLKVELGNRWYESFLKNQLDRGGLFLWAAADGTFVLSTPNGDQAPSYEIQRIARDERGTGKVISHCWQRNSAERFSKWVVYGRGGGRNFGRPKTQTEFVDQEMAELFGSPDASINTHHDKSCDTVRKCDFLARRRCAEANREGWSLTYTLAGHSTTGRYGKATWAQDTIVAVDDRELGLTGNFYLESLTMNRQPQTTTTIRLMRPSDLLFGEPS